MPPYIATLLTTGFILSLFVWDWQKQPKVSAALWLPVMWMAITGSRFIGQWISLGSPSGAPNYTEGSLVDALYFLTLILGGIVILMRRKVILTGILRNNLWLTAFLLYAIISVAWSDYSLIAFKRYIKALGHPIMALLILSDPDPKNALRVVMKRCAYLLIPASILFIKYFPEYGRGYDYWTGRAFSSGVARNKNELGYVCMVLGIFFFWNLQQARHIKFPILKTVETLLSLGFLSMIGWLLFMANSATSIVTFVIGASVIGLLGMRIVNKRMIGIYTFLLVLVGVLANSAFDMHADLLALLGRDPTLTDRTLIWVDCLSLVTNPIFGTGFESFWLGWRLEVLWEKWWWQPNQAHNGYLETYLNLGAVGVLLLGGWIFSTFHGIGKQLVTDFEFGRLRLAYFFAILAYNYTESAFTGVHLVWTVFFIIAIEYGKSSYAPSKKSGRLQKPV